MVRVLVRSWFSKVLFDDVRTYGNGVVSCNEVWIRNGVVGIRCGEVMVW